MSARRLRIDGHACCATSVGKRVRIVKVRTGLTNNGARFNPRTGLRNTALRQLISVRGIANSNFSVNHNRSARGARGGGGRNAYSGIIKLGTC